VGSTALQLVLSGIGTGSIYALIAVGFNVIFKSTGSVVAARSFFRVAVTASCRREATIKNAS